MAAFDLDGTLVERFTLPRFVVRLASPPTLLLAMGAGLGRVATTRTRASFKEGLLRAILRDRPVDEVRAHGREFAREAIEHRLDPATVTILRRHQQRGDEIVVVTAALDVYARPIAEHLGCDQVIAATVEVEVPGRCTGRIIDAGLHGQTKVDRLRSWLGGPAVVSAYGNSRDDQALLDFASSTQEPLHRERRPPPGP